jgi:2'-5' RNA ligase
VIGVAEAAPAVGEWRRRYTHDGPLGMPPHVTLLYPFVPADRLDREVEERLAWIVARAESFEFKLRGTARWPEILCLAPEPSDPFRA